MEFTLASTVTLIVLVLLGAIALAAIFSSFFTVQQQTAASVERFGKFVRIATAGLNLKIPFIDKVARRLSMRIQQLDVKVETKTMDDVFVHVVVSIQYYVLENKLFEAFYKLQNPEAQINSYVFDVVRARVPKIKLDDVFANKDEIANAVKAELSDAMDDFGYGIVKALVTDIDPDEKVKRAMNEINAAQRERIAAQEKGEAEKILKVKQAEAEAESKKLQGQGIANQRKAIVEGLRDSVEQFRQAVDGATARDVMQLVLITQWLDTLKEVGSNTRSNTILLPHSPGALADIAQQLQTAVMTGNLAAGGTKEAPDPETDNKR